MKKRTDSILSVVHETVKDLHNAGIMDEVTMREFDSLMFLVHQTLSEKDMLAVADIAEEVLTEASL